jgi:hypothetical protein
LQPIDVSLETPFEESYTTIVTTVEHPTPQDRVGSARLAKTLLPLICLRDVLIEETSRWEGSIFGLFSYFNLQFQHPFTGEGQSAGPVECNPARFQPSAAMLEIKKEPLHLTGRTVSSAPTGFRTPVSALRGPRPGPLDDGGAGQEFYHGALFSVNQTSLPRIVSPIECLNWYGSLGLRELSPDAIRHRSLCYNKFNINRPNSLRITTEP